MLTHLGATVVREYAGSKM